MMLQAAVTSGNLAAAESIYLNGKNSRRGAGLRSYKVGADS